MSKPTQRTTGRRGQEASPDLQRLRLALIASARFPIREPFAGGLEAHTWALAKGLRRRGHQVTVFASSGCDPSLEVAEIAACWPRISRVARADVSMRPQEWVNEHHAYLQLMMGLADGSAGRFDLVHNNCLHYLPIAMARLLATPMVATLHTPPTPWLESAIQAGPCPVRFATVSQHTARAWAHQVPRATVIHNGVDPDLWRLGPGGPNLVWSGRLVPEKGADLAIAAARRAGLPLDIAGPIGDLTYFQTQIEPHLNDSIHYLGHLNHHDLARLLGQSLACLVTPRWDEPYGLVLAEALACGTPVCGFARGALPELLTEEISLLVAPDDVDALASAVQRVRLISRAAAREYALAHCSQEVMIDKYEALYAELLPL
jgi:glycosyltransferase involved in cell wall biosynthesis